MDYQGRQRVRSLFVKVSLVGKVKPRIHAICIFQSTGAYDLARDLSPGDYVCETRKVRILQKHFNLLRSLLTSRTRCVYFSELPCCPKLIILK